MLQAKQCEEIKEIVMRTFEQLNIQCTPISGFEITTKHGAKKKGFSAYTGQTNDNTMFRIDLDDNIWIYKCDEENKTVTKSMLEDSKARTRNVFSDDNYVIRCYPNSYELFDHAYDVYREK